MARISFLNLEPVHQLQQTAQPGQASGMLSRLSVGEIIRSQVVRDLGNGLFALNFRGVDVVASSSTPLSPGQVLTLQVSRNNGQGQVALHALTLADGAIAAAEEPANTEGLINEQQPDVVARRLAQQLPGQPAVRPGTAALADSQAAPEQLAPAPATAGRPAGDTDRLAELIRPDGPLARLLLQRPDLAPRLTELLTQLVDRPPGLGQGLGQLIGRIDQFLRTLTPEQQTAVSATLGRLAEQSFGTRLFDQPNLLAQTFANRLGALARGLESNASRLELPPAPLVSQATGPALAITSNVPGAAHLAAPGLGLAGGPTVTVTIPQAGPPPGASTGATATTVEVPPSASDAAVTADSKPPSSAAPTAQSANAPPTPPIAGERGVDFDHGAIEQLAQQLRSFLAEAPKPLTQQTRADLVQRFQELLSSQPRSQASDAIAALSRELLLLAGREASPELAVRIALLARGFERVATPPAQPGTSAPAATSAPTTSAQAAATGLAASNLAGPGTSDAHAPIESAAFQRARDPQAAPGPAEAKIPPARSNESAVELRIAQPAVGAERTQADRAGPTPATDQPVREIIQAAFESDLKGQLLELRAQLLHAAQSRPQATPSIEQAVARVDTLLDQVTAQQIRNVDGLNQFLYIELPVDPRTGIDEARLHVFYRKSKGSVGRADSDRFTVAVFLNMTRLGDVLAVVSAVENAVTVAFTVQDSAVEQLLGAQSDHLRDALVASGHAGATITVRRSPPKDGAQQSEMFEEIWSLFLDGIPRASDPGRRLNTEA